MGLLLSFLFFPLLGTIGLVGYYFYQERQLTKALRSELESKQSIIARQSENIQSLQTEVDRLSPYSVIPDAQAHAAELIRLAQVKANQISAQYEAYAAQVTQWANQLTESARRQEQEALQRKAGYEQIEQAMKNVIEGYGDQYIIPSQGLLDDLAEEFSYAQAGQALKKARALTREMIKQKTAASCDYAEDSRRDTAIRFVLDAFSGKVDSILADVKDDNVGTLEQEIKDAYSLVNYNSKDFLNARVTEGFLLSRLGELKWAAIAQQLRLRERQEQNRIREQMREEEKARKEYERATKEAAHQEQLLQKAMETAKQQVANATSEERAAYEEKLKALSEQLKEAREKGEIAVSMARQTKKGHVYIISNIGSFGEGVYKIGQTRRLDPQDRVDELGDSSVPFEFDVHAMIKTDDAPGLERRLHKRFVLSQMNKVNPRKEFFRMDLSALKQEIEKVGLDPKWTLTANAVQYRESIAIQKSLDENPKFRADWMQKQIRADSLTGLGASLEDEALPVSPLPAVV